MAASDPRDTDLIDRAERYGDELDQFQLHATVAVLVALFFAVLAAIVIVAVQTLSPPLVSIVSPPDDRGPVVYRDDQAPIPTALRIHGHSAPVAS